jgi:LPXTG-motif cell wall-anchored protein
MFSNVGILAGIGVAGVAGYYFLRKKRVKLSRWAKEGEGKVDSDEDIDFLSGNKQ